MFFKKKKIDQKVAIYFFVCKRCQYFFNKRSFDPDYDQMWYNHICKAIPGVPWKCSVPGCHDGDIRETNCREVNKKGHCSKFKANPPTYLTTFLNKIFFGSGILL